MCVFKPVQKSKFRVWVVMENSPSYTGNIHDVSSTVDFLYCMPLGNALEILIG